MDVESGVGFLQLLKPVNKLYPVFYKIKGSLTTFLNLQVMIS